MRSFNTRFYGIIIPVIVFLFALLYRMPSLGLDFVNNDDHHWKTRGYAFSTAISNLDFAGTAVTYHPGITLLWSQFSAIKTYGILNRAGYTPQSFGLTEFLMNHVIQNTYVVIFTSILIAFLYVGLKNIMGRKAAIFAILVLCLEPFFTALSRTIHLDSLMSLLMFNGFVYYYLSLENKSIRFDRNTLLSGIFTGLALLTKSAALYLIPFYLLISLYCYFKSKERTVFFKLTYLYTFSLLVFFLAWPAMWVNPIETIQLYLFRGVQGVAIEEGHEHIWFGQKVQDPGWTFYPLVVLSRYSTVLVLSFFFGIIYFLNKFKRNIIDQNLKEFVILNLIYFIGFILMISLTSKKLDRYALPLIFPMIIVAVYYLPSVIQHNFKKWALVCFIYLITGLVVFYGIHPNYLAYYSQLVGGYDRGREIIEPKWMVGYDELADYFNRKDNPELIKVAMADKDYIVPFARFQVIDINDVEKRAEAQYFVIPEYRHEQNREYIRSYKLKNTEDDITIAGISYYRIYQNLTPKVPGAQN